MVTVALLLLALSGAAPLKQAGPAEAVPTPALAKSGLPKIRSITMTSRVPAPGAAGTEHPDCASFVLSEADAREFLTKAGKVTQHDFAHMLDWSPCHAAGRVMFANGRRATWDIQQLRAGSLTMDDGRTIHLYCPSCRAGAYATAPE